MCCACFGIHGQSVSWDIQEGITEISSNLVKTANDSWNNGYIASEDLEIPTLSGDIKILSTHLDPSVNTSNFVVGLGYDKSSNLSTKNLKYAFKYESNSATLYLTSNGKIIYTIGRFKKASDIEISLDKSRKYFLIKLNGNAIKNYPYINQQAAITLKGYAYSKNSIFPQCSSQLTKKAWIVGDLGINQDVSVKLGGSPISTDDNTLKINQNQLNTNGMTELLIAPTVQEEIQWTLKIEIDSDGLISDSYLIVDGFQTWDINNFITVDKLKRSFAFKKDIPDTFVELAEVPYRLSLKDHMLLYPNATEDNSLQLITTNGFTYTSALLTVKDINEAEIFSSNNPENETWDGKINESVIPGTYTYTLTIDGITVNGQFLVHE